MKILSHNAVSLSVKHDVSATRSDNQGQTSATAVPPYSLRQLVAGSIVATTVLLGACSSSTDYDFEQSVANATSQVAPAAAFDLGRRIIPFPNSLLFVNTTDGSQSQDGTLNIAVADPEDFADPQVALNAIDGFSTTEPLTAPFTQPIDPASAIIGTSVRVMEVTTDPANPLIVTSVVNELQPTQALATPTGDGKTLAIVPLQPLRESTSYMVVVTNALLDTEGRPMGRSLTFDLLAGSDTLADPLQENLRGLTLNMIGQAGTQSIAPEDISIAWVFKTQSITPVLQAAKDNAVASTILVQPAGISTMDANPALQGKADILVGTLEIPYYLSAPAEGDPQVALNSFWRAANGGFVTAFNPVPAPTSTQTIPVLMTVPNANSATGGTAPAAGWPIAIFQHGITRNRSDMLAIADAMADAGYAVVAIDLPMHGITDTSSNLYNEGGERTFDLDLRDNSSGASGPDGTIDDSGQYFINLTNLLNSRDNLRQGVADLFTLSASVTNLPGIDPSRKAFVGLSLGAITGATAIAFDDSYQSATLAAPGGGIARFLIASPTFGPTIIAGLAANGVDIESAAGQQFTNATQTAIDPADPINFAAATVANSQIHLVQMQLDTVIPGAVEGAALSGTAALVRQMGLPTATSSTSGDAHVLFATGAHGALLSPGADLVDLAVTTELQMQTAAYAATAGTQLPITNTELVTTP